MWAVDKHTSAPMIYQPFVFFEEDVTGRVCFEWDPEAMQQIKEILLRREFSTSRQDMSLLAAFSRDCLFCGKTTMHPGELLIRLVQHHQA